MSDIRSLWVSMKGVLRTSRQIINDKLEPLNLTGTEGDILYHLFNGSNRFLQEQLAELLDIGKTAISRAIDSLEDKGYVTRMRWAEDKRAYNICLTEKGYSIQTDVTYAYHRLYEVVRKGISDDELLHIESILATVAKNLNMAENASC